MTSVESKGDANQVIPRLWLGNKRASMDSDFLQRTGINVVFNCTKDLPFSPLVQRQYRVPIDDNLEPAEIQNLLNWSPEIVYKLIQEYKRGATILVHCHAGMQRSAAVVAMVLIAFTGQPAPTAMAYIRSRRPIAFFPEANFKAAIVGFEKYLHEAVQSRRHNGGR